MRALVLERPGSLALVDVPPPLPPGPGEVAVRVRAVGVCGTDLHAFRGKQPMVTYPRVLGHELGVEVESVGAGVVGFAPGDRCAVEPCIACGACRACARGRGNCCARLEVLGVHRDGGMRERLVLPARALHRADLSFEQLALVETLAIGVHAARRVGAAHGDRALVIGCGPIGLSAIAASRARGARVAAVDLDPRRRAFCRDQLGVEHALDALDPVAVERACDGRPDLVIDATGSIASMRAAFAVAGQATTLAFVGFAHGEIAFDDVEFHRRELSVLACRNATGEDFADAIALLTGGAVDADAWIGERVDHGAAVDAFTRWTTPGCAVVKAMIGF